jgi:hypothetical protein
MKRRPFIAIPPFLVENSQPAVWTAFDLPSDSIVLSKAANEALHSKDGFSFHSLGGLSFPISRSGNWMPLISSSSLPAGVEHVVEPVIAAFEPACTTTLVWRFDRVIRYTYRFLGPGL